MAQYIFLTLVFWTFLINFVTVVKSARNDRVSPNFVYILTDDQDLMLNGLVAMKKSLNLIGDRGKFFVHAFVNTPICCPSRSTILTGKYPHNTGVLNNSLSGNCSSEYWQKHHEPHSIAALLKAGANYTTFYAGKYLNQYGSKYAGGTSHVPEGYDWWIGLKGNSKYYNYTLSVNGTNLPLKNLYLTDLLANYSLAFLNQKNAETSPFFMMVAPPASHSPFIPPKRYIHKFPGVGVVTNPSFNYTPHNKHWIVKMAPKRLPTNVTILNQIQRRRLQTLLAVDDLVERIVLQLKKLKVFHKTYFIINSDNGFHIGQFGQPWDKRQPYEADTRVPLLFSGPGIGKKILEPYPVSSVDMAPTILDLAGIKPPHHMDGKSFKKHLLNKRNKIGFKFVFMEYWGEGNEKTIEKTCPWSHDDNLAECSVSQWCKCQDSRNNTYSCVMDFREELRFKFCRFADSERFVEAYNLSLDPYELRNVYPKMNSKLIRYGVKEILMKDERIFINLTYSPRAITLKRKFGNLPVRYMRTKLENTEEFRILEKVVRRYKFNLLDEEADMTEKQPVLMAGPSSSSSASSPPVVGTKRKLATEEVYLSSEDDDDDDDTTNTDVAVNEDPLLDM